MKVIGDKVLIKVDEVESKTLWGVIIPIGARDSLSAYGTVIATGTGERLSNGNLRAPDVKPGDRVIFDKMAGSSVKIDGNNHVVLKEFNILGVLT